MFKNLIAFSCLMLLLYACSPVQEARTTAVAPLPSTLPQKAEREFRAAWVATVANINWPRKPGLSVDSQKIQALAYLDFLKANNFNAVIFQVRPQADALYKSNIEPWSYFLTGEQGKAPDPYYDPLEFWTEAAHDRGLEMHVWLNPYRVHHPSGGPVTESSIARKKPELVLKLKTEGYYWFDPALEGTKAHSTAVVMDIVKRYDIDGIHFDDYFYPYREYNKMEDFPDSVSYAAYQAKGGKMSRGDYRRDAVNSFISNLYKQIKKEKKHVKFGLSPFGIWRPGYPEGICCFDQYDVLYADAKLWLNKGWIDYFSPQLYWPITRMNTSFPLLLGWWRDENTMNRHLWPGINIGNDTSAKNVTEVMNQIMIDRGMLPQSKGVIHWSIGQTFKNENMQKALMAGPYKNAALVPRSPWLDNDPPAMPLPGIIQKAGDTSTRFTWGHGDEKDVFRWVVYHNFGTTTKAYKILDRKERSVILPDYVLNAKGERMPLNNIAVVAVDRMGNESQRRILRD
jgi:uncharacterized lipoprotein YddW (UPF0748 family)